MDELLNTKWKSTRVGTPPLKGDNLNAMLHKLQNEWQHVNETKLAKEYKFTNFNRALQFANLVGGISDELNHHPDLHLAWGKCIVEIWTHRIDGIAEMDFVYAAQVEKIYQEKFKELLS
ncbi:MAG: 4a-hydroxytetrahydrobiopterin dehydratase [Candidatus Kariarchaeaceae archaeon]|jgi:4a-hydroxytetrahydrobiopterin dehydratase